MARGITTGTTNKTRNALLIILALCVIFAFICGAVIKGFMEANLTSINPYDCSYELESTIRNDEYILLDRLTAGSDGVKLQSQTGRILSHEFNAVTNLSLTFPLGFEVGGVSLGYTFSTDNISLNGQFVDGLKKNQTVEFYYLRTDYVFGVYNRSDRSCIGTLIIPSVTYDFKVYNSDLQLIKDIGESWLPDPLTPNPAE